MRYDPPLQSATLIRRYKRFLADVQMPDGQVSTIHCPNTGAMTNCGFPGDRVWYSTSDNPKRKYRHTWELVETGGHMIGINSARANAMIFDAIEAGEVEDLAEFRDLRREVRYGESSRADMHLIFADDTECFVEVKSVTLLDDARAGQGLFPDAVSVRARRHLDELINVRRQGARAALIYCVQHSGIERVAPAAQVDPDYAEALARACDAGVEVLAYGAEHSPNESKVARRLPVESA